MELIRVKNLKKTYHSGTVVTDVIKDIDLVVEKGDFVTITGPSGSGKSTLMYLLSGLEPVTGGEVFINQANITKMDDLELSALRREKIAFVFQFYNLLTEMSVTDNILLPSLIEKGKVDKDKIKDVLDLVGLNGYEYLYPYELSGGQQQRVAIARALYSNPEIIFADEPTGNLDSHTSAEVMELMRKVVKEQNKTLVMVTHDNHLATFADRIFHIIDGKIVKVEVRDHSHEGSVTEAKTVEELTQEEFTITEGQKISETISDELQELEETDAIESDQLQREEPKDSQERVEENRT